MVTYDFKGELKQPIFLQVGSGCKIWMFSKLWAFRWFDVFIKNLPKGLSTVDISSMPSTMFMWNAHNPTEVEALFKFVDGFLNDDVPLLLFLHEFNG